MQTAIDGVDITDNGSYKKGCGVGFEGSPRRGGTMSANPPRADASPFASEIRLILIAALLLFTYTVVVGILNGVDAVEFDRRVLLAHLHIGTLGWITMAVFAGSLTLFGSGAAASSWVRMTALAAPVVAAGYNVAFMTTSGIARPVLGSLMTLVIILMAVWGFSQARGRTLSVPHLGMLAGLATSVIGALLGVLLGLRISNPDLNIAETVGEAHPATMVVGFLIPVGMAFSEWVLNPASVHERAGRLGWLQIGLPFIGGVSVVLGILLDILPLVMLSLPFEIVGAAIFIWRMLPLVRRVGWMSTDMARHGAVASGFLIVNIVIFVYLISNYAEDFEQTPRRLMLALDHSIFIGVLTMAIMGYDANVSQAARAPWIDHAVFGGISVGAALFVAGLLADTDPLIHAGTPLLGVAILLGIAVHAMGLIRAGAARA